MNKVIFIDRDGVINRDIWGYVEKWEQFEFMPGALQSLKALTDEEFTIAIISNQAGVGDGIFTQEALNAVNQRMLTEIDAYGAKIAGTYYCPHSKTAGCECRKPKTGLLKQAAAHIRPYDKSKTYYIGDKLSDVQAGRSFGVKTIMVLTGYGTREKDRITDETRPDFIVENIKEAVDMVLQKEHI